MILNPSPKTGFLDLPELSAISLEQAVLGQFLYVSRMDLVACEDHFLCLVGCYSTHKNHNSGLIQVHEELY